ncbi:MAG TPA: exodeoxyribonuclease VII small subunit [Gammaproteobacteria bacterium]
MPKTTRKPKASAESTENTTVAGFENSLGELEELVERLESGEQSLEDALKDFERGIVLTRQCQHALKHAELRVQQLLQRDGEESLEDFEAGRDEA